MYFSKIPGHCCYYPITNCWYIYANVTFFEETPYFVSSVEPRAVYKVLHIPYFGPPPSSLQVMLPESLEFPIVQFEEPCANAPQCTFQCQTRAIILEFEIAQNLGESYCTLMASPAINLPKFAKFFDDLPIALRKRTRFTRNPYLVYNL